MGGGFGGLETVKALRGAPVEATLIDRNNYHLFQPLNYQVATGALSPDEIAEPLRTIFRRDAHVRIVMGEVTDVDLEQRIVRLAPRAGALEPRSIGYDTLVVAGGSAYSYFGHEDWRPIALEVKSLDSALEVRGRILRAFEAAELDQDPEDRAAWLTFVVVGGGPTGVEMAGQIAELARDTLPGDFRAIDPRVGRVLLVEAEDRVLPSFPARLSGRAAESLEQLGVATLVNHTVVGIDPYGVELHSDDGQGERVAARTVVWAAGVAASPLAGILAGASGTELDRTGRVTVEPDLTLAGHPTVLAIGDMVRVRNASTGDVDTLPGLAPVAMQEGRYAGRLIGNRLAGRTTEPFRYRDKGSLATIGRARAVADLRGLKLSGFIAWITWLLVHLYYLIGFENRLVVLVRWSYNFLTRGRGGRLITEAEGRDRSVTAPDPARPA
ncbi:MAG TPA: NAD(P)/FAD-dependent oxidoreductase [Methylomirabilota bacterium]